MADIQVPAFNKGRLFNWPRIFGYGFFISFKLGHPPIDASCLALKLQKAAISRHEPI